MFILKYKFLIKLVMRWLVKSFTECLWCFLLISCFSYWGKMVDPAMSLLPRLSEGNISRTVPIYHSTSFQLLVRATWLLIWKTIYVHTILLSFVCAYKLLSFFYFMLWQVSFNLASFLSPIFLNNFQNRFFYKILHTSSWFFSARFTFNITQLHQSKKEKK